MSSLPVTPIQPYHKPKKIKKIQAFQPTTTSSKNLSKKVKFFLGTDNILS